LGSSNIPVSKTSSARLLNEAYRVLTLVNPPGGTGLQSFSVTFQVVIMRERFFFQPLSGFKPSMSVRIAKSLIRLVLLLITFQCVSPVLAKVESSDSHHTIVSSKSDHSSIFSSILFEKMEEEEKSEEEKDRFVTIELLDLSKINTLLSQSHTPNTHFIFHHDRYDRQPALFTLFCVYLI
jgi:hypothetical protein